MLPRIAMAARFGSAGKSRSARGISLVFPPHTALAVRVGAFRSGAHFHSEASAHATCWRETPTSRGSHASAKATAQQVRSDHVPPRSDHSPESLIRRVQAANKLGGSDHAILGGFLAAGPVCLLALRAKRALLRHVFSGAFGPAAPALRVVAQAAQRTNADPAARVEVSGYTDSAGSPQADVLLSQQRAQAVADALVASGVAADRLVRKGQGQTGGNPGIASRRVEITVGDFSDF
jgi:hypothetical protein